jgi:hypothetical protein
MGPRHYRHECHYRHHHPPSFVTEHHIRLHSRYRAHPFAGVEPDVIREDQRDVDDLRHTGRVGSQARSLRLA